ncbi:hypothetical protein CONCODRAFT_8638 [Conidiobolus coronatus NRRL 28638]|uniref:holo-[acyl-carrier-protein] synthase n=1 Tax=Conidiobolus coronatus (strain ATCC 28846 / CBS 209.66 / NRRL 28638) TaxID=796925 RepID=A0A137P1Q6_CONC2|nr:hypothetical protein CONCODRAFT_8638 [Conidiobolus coronatus NRRL 28638]|eukprot:KXN68995.1 hypothetical protein CONCODRAFT_8638 [Conidiobolus coronatus NRRL 28638]
MNTPKILYTWYFNTSKWNPTDSEFNHLCSKLPPLGEKKVRGFIQLKDRKSALISQLLRYKLFFELRNKLKLDNIAIKDILFQSTKEGRPSISPSSVGYTHFSKIDFNITHHGDIVALVAAEGGSKVGVDVMKIELPSYEKDLDSFLEVFKTELSDREWNQIKLDGANDGHSLNIFYEIWCLKEALLKSYGTGLTDYLSKEDFNLNGKPRDAKNVIWNQSTIDHFGKPLNNIKFQENYLNEDHCICTAVYPCTEEEFQENCPITYEEVTINELDGVLG